MQEYEWIPKVFIGFLGTMASFLLESISLVVSITAGLLTIIFLLQQITMVHKSHEYYKHIWKFGKEKRDSEKKEAQKKTDNRDLLNLNKRKN